MKVFISWSGNRSKEVATALTEWLPDVIQRVDPWMSDHDIHAGSRWSTALDKELAVTNFGVICLTPENIEKPWVLFEAGSLSKSISEARVVPYRLDLGETDVKPPLSQFQGVDATCEGTYRLISSINQAGTVPLPEERLKRLFEKLWPELETKIENILKQPLDGKVLARSEIDYLKEIGSIRNSQHNFTQ